jgi:hypothetical protein
MEGNVALSSGGAEIGRCDIHIHLGGETKRSRVTVILTVATSVWDVRCDVKAR